MRTRSAAGLASAAGRVEGGWLRVWASEEGVVEVEWPREEEPGADESGGTAAARKLARQGVKQTREYLAGQRQEFTVPVDWRGQTAFTRQVLEACARVPYGETVSYGELARQIGSPKAARAVGQALGRNPVPLIVPCHRVIAGGGGLGGFGGGLAMKRRLLELEGKG